MSNLKNFHSQDCPRCQAHQFFRLGDAHFTVTPLLEQVHDKTQAAPDLTCYVKVCRNCAYTEFYSKFLVDDFEATEGALGAFGVISRPPSGDYLVSVFRDYEYKGKIAHDFTVPLSADAWFQLALTLDDLSDDQVVQAVLYGPYLKAWKERIGAVPGDLGKKLRALITRYLQDQKDGDGSFAEAYGINIHNLKPPGRL